jgi:hypothetical protein
MSDQHDAGSLPELTPEQEAEVRRLLAEARHDEPIPTGVADRLDTVLAGLTRDDPGAAGIAPVIDLATHRRRRNAAALLAGAAAVIVAGFGIGQVIGVGSDDSGDNATSSAADADRSDAAADKAQEDGTGGGVGVTEGTAPEPYATTPFRLSSKHLARDINHQLRGLSAASDSVKSPEPPEAFSAVGCVPPTHSKFGLGDLFPALFDDAPAVLALRPPADGTQQADVLACDTAEQLDSVTLTPR